MAERERRITPPYGGVFHARSLVLSPEDIQRAVWRMAHEVIERNQGLENVVLIGLQTGGVPLAGLLADDLQQIEAVDLPVGTLDVAFYRDDIGLRPVNSTSSTSTTTLRLMSKGTSVAASGSTGRRLMSSR